MTVSYTHLTLPTKRVPPSPTSLMPPPRHTLAHGFRLTCMGLFLSSSRFGLFPVLCSERKGRSSSRRLRSGSRSARKGQGTKTLAKLGGLPLGGACVSQRLDA